MKLPPCSLLVIFYLLLPTVLVGQSVGPSVAIAEANDLIREDRYDEAGVRLQRTLDSLHTAGDSLHPLYGELWHKLGVIHYMTSELEAAAQATQQAVRFRPRRSPADQVALSRSLYLHAAIRRELGDLSLARSELKRAMLLMEHAAPLLSDESNITRLMNMYTEYSRQSWQAGDLHTALDYWDKAFSYYRQDPEAFNYHLADLHFLKSKILKRLDRYPEAVEALQRARSLWSGSDDTDYLTSVAAVDNNLGVLFWEMGDKDRARRYLQSARSRYQNLISGQNFPHYHQELVNVQANLLRVFSSDADEENVRATYQAGLNHARQGWRRPDNSIVADLQQAYAGYWAERQRFDSSYYYFRQALQATNPYWRQSGQISMAHTPIPDKGKAADILLSRLSVEEQEYELNRSLAALERAQSTTTLLDSLLVRIRQSYEAANSKYDLLKRTHPFYEQAIRISLDLYDRTRHEDDLQIAYNFITKNKAAVLLEGLQNEQAKDFARIPTHFLRQEQNLKRRYYQLESRLYESYQTKATEVIADIQDSLFTVGRAYRQLIDRLETDFPAYHQLKYQSGRRILTTDVQSQLPKKTLLLEYFIGEEEIFLFAIDRQDIRHYRLARPEQFNTTVAGIRRLISEQRMDQQQYRKLGYELYQWLLAEVLTEVNAEEEVKRLIIIPDGVLLQIPFEMLLTEAVDADLPLREYPYLMRDLAVSYVYSNQLLFNKRNERRLRRRDRFAGFGLEYDDYTIKGIEQAGFELKDQNEGQRAVGPLVYADDEVQEIAELLNGDIWINQQATKSAFLQHADRYHIIHLSMHGLVDEQNPMNSSLVFARTADSSDYLLRAAELFTLPLEAEMAVLSACHTAYGPLIQGEGIRSLSRAFTYAGCASLVSSLWSASDKSTKDILTYFYRHLQRGSPKDVALQQAKLDYLQQAPPTLSGPNHWAHLILIGDRREMYSLNKRKYEWLYLLGIGLLMGGFFFYNRKKQLV